MKENSSLQEQEALICDELTELLFLRRLHLMVGNSRIWPLLAPPGGLRWSLGGAGLLDGGPLLTGPLDGGRGQRAAIVVGLSNDVKGENLLMSSS